MIDKYYEDELRYLYDSGREFAKTHPDRAAYLNIDAVGDRDPSVERLFEGFAFLTARIRETIDDTFPELTEGLIQLLWPRFLQEIPSTTIVEFSPRKGHLQKSHLLPRGSQMLSKPVGNPSTACPFTTTHDVPLNPLSITAVDYAVDRQGGGSLSLTFTFEDGVKAAACSLDTIRLFLHAEMPTALMLHEFFTAHVTSALITDLQSGTAAAVQEPPVTPAGLTAAETLLPPDARSFHGYSLLLEYFVCPEKFLFVNLHGLAAFAAQHPDVHQVRYTVFFSRALPPGRPIRADMFRLHCAPAVNLFDTGIQPLSRDSRQRHYPLSAGNAAWVHSIISVTGINRQSSVRRAYELVFTFKNLGAHGGPVYIPQYRTAPSGRRELSLGFAENEAQPGSTDETIAIEARCHNGTLTRDELHEGDIRSAGSAMPDFVKLVNITRPTPVSATPVESDYQWIFLAHQGITISSLAHADTLRAFLRLYDRSGSEGSASRIAAISDVTCTAAHRIHSGALIRGSEFTVTFAERADADNAELRLFGLVFSEFLTQFAPINSFVELSFVLKPSGTAMRFDPHKGSRCPL